jgi:uncharacterized protein
MKTSCRKCGKGITLQDNPFRPFCSKQCQMTDLGKWVDEEYRVQGDSDNVIDMRSRQRSENEDEIA